MEQAVSVWEGSMMEIKIQIRGRVYGIYIGHETKFFEQLPWFLITEEHFDADMNVVYAIAKFSLGG